MGTKPIFPFLGERAGGEYWPSHNAIACALLGVVSESPHRTIAKSQEVRHNDRIFFSFCHSGRASTTSTDRMVASDFKSAGTSWICSPKATPVESRAVSSLSRRRVTIENPLRNRSYTGVPPNAPVDRGAVLAAKNEASLFRSSTLL